MKLKLLETNQKTCIGTYQQTTNVQGIDKRIEKLHAFKEDNLGWSLILCGYTPTHIAIISEATIEPGDFFYSNLRIRKCTKVTDVIYDEEGNDFEISESIKIEASTFNEFEEMTKISKEDIRFICDEQNRKQKMPEISVSQTPKCRNGACKDSCVFCTEIYLALETKDGFVKINYAHQASE